jgi:hypothetical protein
LVYTGFLYILGSVQTGFTVSYNRGRRGEGGYCGCDCIVIGEKGDVVAVIV